MAARSETVIVVGGGIVGIACAHYLQKAGFGVTVIDRSGIGQACSHGNCGFICPSHVLPLNEPGALREGLLSLLNPTAPLRIRPQMRLGLYRWLLQFARRCTHRQMLDTGGHLLPMLESSIHEYHQLFSELPKAGEWKENGLAYVFREQASLEAFAKTDRLLSKTYGITARRIEETELAAFDPALKTDLAGAYVYDQDGSVRPDQLVRDWRTHLSRSGVGLVENCRLDEVRKSSGSIASLLTSSGEMTADHYVFALGAWSSKWSDQLHCELPVEPGKGYSVTMNRPETCPQHPMLFPERRIGVTPFDDGFRIGSMMEFAGWDSSIPQRRIEQLKESAAPYLVTPVGKEVRETWFGWRPMTWDSLPIIGRTPRLDNALLATGHNMLGLTMAAATGRLITELVQERPTHIEVAAFSPDRF
ncbi:MAG: FAD-dependent oxidoreductase [Deltaproteobacteria bacterium]|nr:FAD-dependent oxidoreductase [Deltaproteobacteria bacterium]